VAFTAEYIYKILDNYSGPLSKITSSTKKFQRASARASKTVAKLGDKMGQAGSKMASFGGAIGGAAITAGMFKLAQSSSTMSDAMADVARVANLSDVELAKMQERLQAMGRATGKNAEGLAAIAYEGGKLGIAATQMDAFVLMVAKTATGFDMLDSEAGRAIGSIRAKLGLSISSVNELMQRVNYLADTTSASGAHMIEIIERTSGTFKTLGIPPEVTAGWAAFANQVEVSPELAASGLNMMMTRMMKMPGMLDKMLKDPKNAVTNFLKTFEKMPAAQRGAAILKTFGTEAGRFVMKAVANTKLLNEAMDKAGSAKGLGSLDREFANILRRSSTAGKRIKQTFIDIARAIGNTFIKVFDKYSARLIKASEYVLAFVKAHPGLVKLAAGVGAILAAIVAVVVPLGILFSMLAAGLPVISALLGVIGAITAPVIGVVVAVAALVALFATAYAKSDKFRASLSRLMNAFNPLFAPIKEMIFLVGDALGFTLGNTGGIIGVFGDIVSIVINRLAFTFRVWSHIVAIGLKGMVFAFKLLRAVVSPVFNGIVAILKTVYDMVWIVGMAIKNAFLLNFSEAFATIKTLFDPVLALFDMLLAKINKVFDTASGVKSAVSGAFGGAWESMKESVGLGPAKDKAESRAAQNNKLEVTGGINVSASNGAKVEQSEINLSVGDNIAGTS